MVSITAATNGWNVVYVGGNLPDMEIAALASRLNARMVVASFLTKNLRIHWWEGARWFWDTLVDADLANNTLAGVGCWLRGRRCSLFPDLQSRAAGAAF